MRASSRSPLIRDSSSDRHAVDGTVGDSRRERSRHAAAPRLPGCPSTRMRGRGTWRSAGHLFVHGVPLRRPGRGTASSSGPAHLSVSTTTTLVPIGDRSGRPRGADGPLDCRAAGRVGRIRCWGGGWIWPGARSCTRRNSRRWTIWPIIASGGRSCCRRPAIWNWPGCRAGASFKSWKSAT